MVETPPTKAQPRLGANQSFPAPRRAQQCLVISCDLRHPFSLTTNWTSAPFFLLFIPLPPMKIDPKSFRVKAGETVNLKRWPTRVKSFYESKSDYKEKLAEHTRELSEQQNLLYAHDRYSLLVIFQAMDAAGKDGAIKHVMSGVNPQGCQVYSFKRPSEQELDHDFLWRTTLCLPERGRIGIFNRSYYEEVLIARVHPEILVGQRLPVETMKDDAFWKHRYASINEQEKHLHRNGTRIVKIFMHLSEEEQRQRFLARIDDPNKNWKFSSADIKERQHWQAYMEAYGACLGATSPKNTPWYIVPADDKANARLIISRIIVNELAGLKLSYPETDPAHRKELLAIKKQLLAKA
jgi:PPK2 family polyphosphate:nucleotide phosphotransferase